MAGRAPKDSVADDSQASDAESHDNAQAAERPPFDHALFLRQLTSRPGVYRFLGDGDEVLYVGKARNLKKRVSNYFRGESVSPKVQAMRNRMRDLQVTITHTEDEALLLESALIKKHRPRYNVTLRDDKSYPYLRLHMKHDFPRLAFHRGAQKGEDRYFGPYPSASAVRDTISTLQKLFRIRGCDDTFYSHRSRPCLQYQINRCSAPCVGFIEKEAYARDLEQATRFLNGQSDALIRDLGDVMQVASDELDFEKAARLRDQISTLRRVQEQHAVTAVKGDFDLICGEIRSGVAAVVVMSIRNGRSLGHRSFFPRTPPDTPTPEMLSSFIAQYYVTRRAPPLIACSQAPEEAQWLAHALGEAAGRAVVIRGSSRGARARLMDMANKTLTAAISARLSSAESLDARYAALQEALQFEQTPSRLECFDISHTQGEATVASCVVFDSEGANKTAYRRFNIDGIEPGDDYAAIRQAVTRRFVRLRKGEAPMPDVLFIDGGKGQLTQAVAALKELQIDDVLIVSIAKGPERRPGEEILFIGEAAKELQLPPDSPALHLVQQIRDEAHRFAITGHRGRRKKARRQSWLDEIPGLGPKRRQSLLKAFGGIQQIERAGVDDLARVDGISVALAKKIVDYIHEGA